MKQITIYELLPLFRPGCWVAMRPSGDWKDSLMEVK